MFNLIYRDGAPENTGHYEVFDKTKGSGTALAVGRLVSVVNGIASEYVGGEPYGVVAISAADGDDIVAVLRITNDMIFEVGMAKDPVKKYDVGGRYTVASTGVVEENEDGYFYVSEIISNGDTVGGTRYGGKVKGRFVGLDA